MKPAAAIFSWVYRVGLNLDRAVTRALKLPYPVISIGNIAVGGRGKTPFVIEIARHLREQGVKPVVLTRGFGRKSSAPVFLLEGSPLPAAGVDDTGDEALEVFFRGGADVLVSSDRRTAAQDYIRGGYVSGETVFLLDDGFQHWALARDFDLVLVDPKDFDDVCLPLGRLREPLSALERADLILERGRDFEKVSRLRSQPRDDVRIGIVTTRAPDPRYHDRLRSEIPRAASIPLQDHAGAAAIGRAARLHNLQAMIVGAKEAVKLLPLEELGSFFKQGHARAQLGGREYTLHFVECELEISRSDFWSRIERAYRTAPR